MLTIHCFFFLVENIITSFFFYFKNNNLNRKFVHIVYFSLLQFCWCRYELLLINHVINVVSNQFMWAVTAINRAILKKKQYSHIYTYLNFWNIALVYFSINYLGNLQEFFAIAISKWNQTKCFMCIFSLATLETASMCIVTSNDTYQLLCFVFIKYS